MGIAKIDEFVRWIKKVDFLTPHVKFTDEQKLFYPPPFYLLRGESKQYAFPLSSRWNRRKKTDDSNEKKYYKNCFKKLHGFSKPFKSDLNLRFIAYLQHHEFETRLIDATSGLDTALYFAIKDDPDETGYIYKILGYDIFAIANNLDQADIESLFFNSDFPPIDHAITSQKIKLHLFYHDTNFYNLNAIRQNGWFLFQTKNYTGDLITIKRYPVTPHDKKELWKVFRRHKQDQGYYFPDVKQIAIRMQEK